jgi:hypothetical protein
VVSSQGFDFDDLLEARLKAAVDAPAVPDWLDVRRRSSWRPTKQVGARRLVPALVAAAALLAAIPALAFRSEIIDFFKSSPAPKSVVVEFNRLAVLQQLALRNGTAFPSGARRITRVEVDGKSSVLYVAPTTGGGFCAIWSSNDAPSCFAKRRTNYPSGVGQSGSASSPTPDYASLGWSAYSPQEGIDSVEGEIFVRGASVQISYKDGKTADIPYVWVSQPIAAGFFLYSLPNDRRTGKRRPVALSVVKDGNQLAHVTIDDVAAETKVVNHYDRWHIQIQTSPEAIWSKRRLLYSFNTADGRLVEAWVMPSRRGPTRRCVATTYSSRCESAVSAGAPLDLHIVGVYAVGQSVLIDGETSAAVARVNLKFEDGTKLTLRPRSRLVIAIIPPAHYALGHRLVRADGYDASGRQLAATTFDPRKRDIYPCAKPKNYGAGVRMCP